MKTNSNENIAPSKPIEFFQQENVKLISEIQKLEDIIQNLSFLDRKDTTIHKP